MVLAWGWIIKMTKPVLCLLSLIGHDLQNTLLSELSQHKFFSVKADATTDAGNIEVELYLALHFDPFSTDGKVRVRNTFLSARYLKSGMGEGLYESFERAMQYMDIDNWKTKMIGFGCDGASANIAEGGLREILTREVLLIFKFWCLAHHLELSVKDALQSAFFVTIDDVLCICTTYTTSPQRNVINYRISFLSSSSAWSLRRCLSREAVVLFAPVELDLLHTKWQL